jgi:hypothetical protein
MEPGKLLLYELVLEISQGLTRFGTKLDELLEDMRALNRELSSYYPQNSLLTGPENGT